ncbi:MAG: hypothetical protein B7Y85_02965 [Brevundimonas sp. 32-68-21]|nr:MAG: hypothetical protein B7Y85_02965 [Brevundimonas sp. 32-68-21]
MSSKKPVPALIPGLTALTAVALVLVVAAMAATLFGGVDRAVTYDLLTWTVARGLAWVGMAAALLVLALALRDLGRRWIFAVVALVLAGATLAVFLHQGQRLAQPSPRDISTNVAEPPAYSRLSALHPLVDAGFPIVRASTFEVEGVHEGAWFGFAYDAVVRIRPGRTDIRVTARDSRPDGGATCRLTNRIVTALEEEIR